MKKLLLFVLMLLPMVASADDSGKCGNNVYYSYDGTNHTLTIYGEGDMYDYYGEGYFTPWNLYLDVIQSVVIESGVTSIGVGALSRVEDRYCKNLTSVTVPNSVTSIGRYAFYCCSGLTSITIPNSVTSIGSEAFSDCSSLTSITIPNSVTSIGSYAFYGTAWFNNQPDGLVYAGKVAYKYKGDIPENTSLIIEDGTVGIASGAFYGCTGLTSIIIPNSVTSIGSSAFSGFSGLTSITIPNSVTSIGNYAFSGCGGLTSVTIGNNVKSIGYDAFWCCTGLVYITLPSNLTSIGSSCFDGCINLTYIYCDSKDVPSIGKYAFDDTGNITLYVPSESVDAYKSTSPWNEFNVQTNYNSQGAEKCSKPTISLSDGKYVFNCETPYVQYRWVISTPNGNTGELNYVSHSVTLSVFATKYGYQPSDVATYALSGTPVPASVVGNPVITFSLNIINRSGKAVTLDGDVEFLLGNPDHNGTYLGWDGSYNYTDPIRFSGSPVTLAAGETKTFDGLTWCDEETGSGMGEKSPLDPSLWEASSSNRNVKLYVGGSDEVVVCDNMDPSIIFKEGGIYSIVISSGGDTTPVNPTPLVGDVNGDGKVNVADHVKLSEIIMEQDK